MEPFILRPGYYGGLWLLWNSNKVGVESLAKTEQKIHVEIKAWSSNLAWIFFAIYASPRSEERCILWENLAKVVELIVKSESKQRSRCVALRRQQIRRRCDITLKFESRKFEVDVKYILAFCGSCNWEENNSFLIFWRENLINLQSRFKIMRTSEFQLI